MKVSQCVRECGQAGDWRLKSPNEEGTFQLPLHTIVHLLKVTSSTLCVTTEKVLQCCLTLTLPWEHFLGIPSASYCPSRCDVTTGYNSLLSPRLRNGQAAVGHADKGNTEWKDRTIIWSYHVCYTQTFYTNLRMCNGALICRWEPSGVMRTCYATIKGCVGVPRVVEVLLNN